MARPTGGEVVIDVTTAPWRGLADLLREVDEGMVVHAPDGRITGLSDRAADLLGLVPADVLGQLPEDLGVTAVDAAGRPMAIDALPWRLAMAQADVHESVVGVRRPDGRFRWLLVRARPWHWPSGPQAAAAVLRQAGVHTRDLASSSVVVHLADVTVQHGVVAAAAVTEDLQQRLLEAQSLDRGSLTLVAAVGDLLDAGAVDLRWSDEAAFRAVAWTRSPGLPPLAEVVILPVATAGRIVCRLVVRSQTRLPADRVEVAARAVWPLGSDLLRLHAMGRAVQAREDLEDLVEHLPVGVGVIAPDGRWVRVNPTLCDVLGRSERDLIGQDHRIILGELDLRTAEHPEGEEVRVRRPDGRRVTVSILVRRPPATPSAAGPSAICMVQDVSRQRRRERVLQRQINRDALTGLASRRHVLQFAQRALDGLVHADAGVLFLFIDMNGFKGINDRHGHRVGDEVLRHVGRRLRGVIRTDGIVGRIGGDEFLVVCPGITSRVQQGRMVRDIHAALAQPVAVDGLHVPVSASVGSRLVQPNTPARLVDLLHEVDLAMYEEKHGGRPVAAPLGTGDRPAPGRDVADLDR